MSTTVEGFPASIWHTLVEKAPNPILTVARDGTIEYVNHTPNGMAAKDVIGKEIDVVIPAEHRSVARQAIEQVTRTGKMCKFEVHAGQPHDPQALWLVRASPVMAEDEVVSVALFYTDITEHRRATGALRESEERFEKAFRSAPHLVAITRLRDGRIAGANDGFARIAGFSREELVGRTVVELNLWPSPAERDRFRRELEEAGHVRDLETRIRTRSGNVRSVLVSAETISLDGEPHVITVAIDITARKLAEEALRESLEFNRTMLSASPVGIATYGPDGQCVSANEAIAEMVGATMEQVLGQNFLEIESWRRSGLREDARACLSDGVSRRREIHLQSTFGKEIWLDCRASRFFSEGRPHLLMIVDDVCERRRIEADRRSLEAQVQHAQKLESLGVLAGGIAHDFNNLLTGVLGNASLAKRDVLPGTTTRECIDEIERASRRAAELCGEMLAYAGRGKFAIERLDLSSTVREITVLLESSISKRARLELDLASDLPAIEGDGSQIRQVVMNLVTNASEALGEEGGRIIVKTRAETRGDIRLRHRDQQQALSGGLYVRLEVIDDGCGMDEETRTKIFEPFFTTKFAGRGLGLAAALGIVRSHKGAIQVDTGPGAGTTVRVWLPALDPSHTAEERPSPARPAPTEARAPGLMVLVVDDEPLVRSLARRVLERDGYRVLVAKDGREAVQVYEARRDEIDVVVLDLTMPHLGGEETLRELQKIRDDVRVILSSGFSEEEATMRFATMGLAGFLQKPYDATDLRQAVRGAHEGS